MAVTPLRPDLATSWRDKREIVRLASEHIERGGPAGERDLRAREATKALGARYGRVIAEMRCSATR